jgi:hypothetical protein
MQEIMPTTSSVLAQKVFHFIQENLLEVWPSSLQTPLEVCTEK